MLVIFINKMILLLKAIIIVHSVETIIMIIIKPAKSLSCPQKLVQLFDISTVFEIHYTVSTNDIHKKFAVTKG